MKLQLEKNAIHSWCRWAGTLLLSSMLYTIVYRQKRNAKEESNWNENLFLYLTGV